MNRYSMKYIVMTLMLIIILIFNCAYADDFNHYHISFTEASISLPSYCLYADRNVKDEDSICKVLGLSSNEIINKYLDEDYYAMALSGSTALFLQYYASSWSDFSSIKEEYIQDLYTYRLNIIASDGYKKISSGVFTCDVPFFKYIFESDSSDYVVSYCYSTTYNQKEYLFSFVDREQYNKNSEELYDSIIRSVVFDDNKADSLNSFLKNSFRFDDFFLLIRDEYVYTTRDDKDLDYTSQFTFDHDYHVKALVSYDGFNADIISYPREYKTPLSDNECLTEIINYAKGGFGNYQNSITIQKISDYCYMFSGKAEIDSDVKIDLISVYVFHKDGIIAINSNKKIINEIQQNNFVSFLLDLADSIVPLEKMPENKE